MRGICFIALLISATIVHASEDELKAIVWLNGDNYYRELSDKKNVTLFFSEWSTSVYEYLNDDNHRVALQLDRRFDPSPADDNVLPHLEALSAVSDPQIVDEYLDFLENFGRTLGYDYLVMPDTSHLSNYEKEVVLQATKKSPTFFIDRAIVSENLPQSRMDLNGNYPAIWIADQTYDLRRLAKWNKKLNRDFHRSFFRAIKTVDRADFKQTISIPTELSKTIWEHSATVVDPDNRLPIREQAVVYFGRDAELKQWLSKYVRVYDKPQVESYPVILDQRDGYTRKAYGNEIVIDYFKEHTETPKTFINLSGPIGEESVAIAQMLFGAYRLTGRSNHPGSKTMNGCGYLGYSYPEREGFNQPYLSYIDSAMNKSIENFAIPGAQVTVAKNGSIVLDKAYGHYTYDSLTDVSTETIYDLASLTKVLATLPAIALLVDRGEIDLEDSISMYLSDFVGSNKSGITVKQLLAHNGGVRSYIPFWSMAMDGDRLDAFYYKTKEHEEKDIRSYGLEPHPALKDSLKSWIIQSRLIKDPSNYNYSDLGFMILHLLVEEVSGKPFDQFLREELYDPMGLSITFNPQENGYTYEKIAPTEYDQRYRNGQVWGEVHDRNAHVFGGIAGHAGLFGKASDLTKMMMMLLNGGHYGGRQFVSEETLELFNKRYFPMNRRGLGWDKKDGIRDAASALASDQSFGHTGFTGTMVWADPTEDLIYVFLSNRIFPDSNNNRLMELNTRTEIHDVIYEALLGD